MSLSSIGGLPASLRLWHLGWGDVSLGETYLAPDPPLLSSRGQQVDHVALGCANVDLAIASLRRAGVRVIVEPAGLMAFRSAMIKGPDRLAIEILETR